MAAVQNSYWKMLQEVLPAFQHRTETGEQAALDWLTRFRSLGEHLGFAADRLQAPVPALQAAA